MKDKELKIKELLAYQDAFEVHGVQQVNFTPHRYTVGPKHIAEASKYNSGILDNSVLRKVPCEHPGCTHSFEEHTYDVVCFLLLKRDVPSREAAEILEKLERSLEKDYISGFAFVQDENKYVIQPEKPDKVEIEE